MQVISLICADAWMLDFCSSQEKEYKDALEAFNDKNKEKVQLISRLMEVSFTLSRLILVFLA